MLFEKHAYVKSPMNYTGGKYRLLPQILPLFPDRISCFFDMFTGGANIAANVNAGKIIANDISGQITGIYRKLQETDISDTLEYLSIKIQEYCLTKSDKQAYIRFRDMYNKSDDKNPLDLFVLICHSFNNQIRFNRNGEFNMPFGEGTFNKKTEENLLCFYKAIKNVEFTSMDFRKFDISRLDKNSFVYCDPPYLITRATYNFDGGWTEKDENDLLCWIDGLDRKGIRFALSNVMENKKQKNLILGKWSAKYNVHHLNNSYYNCNYHAKDKSVGTTDEVLVTNY
jgi:DNA adenine methylase Dam